MPFLQPIIILPNKMRANLMIKHPLYRVPPIPYRQTNHNPTNSITIIMYNTGRRNSIFNKLISQKRPKFELLNIEIKKMRDLLNIKKG